MSRPAVIRYLRSAGGVIFRNTEAGPEVALIATKNRTVWTLPKGIIDKDESPETAAMREILEETGLRGRILDGIGDKSYWFYLRDENAKCKKTVTYFLLEYTGGEISDASPEVDGTGWFPFDQALDRLTFGSDSEILLSAKEKIEHAGQNG
jgi:8-oxo-dGTP pyrophosphatase MutT (NUDIX family)